ncbi:MAG: hypothetical protein GY854_02320 [Deltaproteobacteria bacterium]|nr:hypothetical protein [Deltaproteobacteria bacterium]
MGEEQHKVQVDRSSLYPSSSLSDLQIIRLSGVPVKADAAGNEEGDAHIWVQVAKAGDYQGYDPPFVLSTEIFSQLVTNFRRHPAYKTGPDGVGNADVAPWDFEHMSVTATHDRATAQVGAPAQGWIQELQTRQGADGKSELWALTRWLPLAREYIKSGQYKWASIAFVNEFEDPVTAEKQGATLISVAITNDPFIQGMQALAATRDRYREIRASYWEAAENASSALRGIKQIMQLPETADVAVISAELAKLRQWVTMGDAPLGVDLQSICGSMRNVLNLPALSTELEVIGEADKLVARILEEQAIQSGQPAAPAEGMESNTAMVAGGKQMDFQKILAQMLGVREDADESVIKAAVEDLVELRSGVKKTFAADKDTTTVLLKAANEIVSVRKVQSDQYCALTSALGTKGDEDPVSRITVLLKAQQELDELRPKYDDLAKKIEKQEEVEAENDVVRVLRAHKLPDNTKAALLQYRRSNPEKFAEEFPVATAEHEHLTVELTSNTRSAVNHDNTKANNVIDLSQYAGRNDAEKMAHYIQDTSPGAKDWTRERLYGEVRARRRAYAEGK